MHRIGQGAGTHGARLIDGAGFKSKDTSIWINWAENNPVQITCESSDATALPFSLKISREEFDDFVIEYVNARQWENICPSVRELFNS